MFKLARLFFQVGLMPPININFNFPPRRHPPPREINIPAKKPGFDPTRKVSNYEARIYAASNSLEERKP